MCVGRQTHAGNILCGLTLGVGGTADDVAELCLEARVVRAVLDRRLVSSGAQ